MEGYSSPKKIKKVGDLFGKYKAILKAPQKTIERAFIESVEDVLGYKISEDKVKYTVSTKTISLNISSVLKSEVLLKQKELLAKVKQKINEEGIKIV